MNSESLREMFKSSIAPVEEVFMEETRAIVDFKRYDGWRAYRGCKSFTSDLLFVYILMFRQ